MPATIEAPLSNENEGTSCKALLLGELPADQKLRRLRTLMSKNFFDAYIIPTSDAHDSEYPRDCDRRRMYITGFTGTAGVAVVTQSEALLWTDGRYFIQAAKELQGTEWKLMKQGSSASVPTVAQWLKEKVELKSIGYDPLTVSFAMHKRICEALCDRQPGDVEGEALKPSCVNLVDQIWETDGRPVPSMNPVVVIPDNAAGQTPSEKISAIRSTFKAANVNACILSALDDVAWVTNLRGSDISFNPVFLAYMVITEEQAIIFVNPSQVDDTATKKHLEASGIEIHPYMGIYTLLEQQFSLPGSSADLLKPEAKRIWLSRSVNMQIYRILASPSSRLHLESSPATSLKAIKNPTELQNIREAHVTDAAALCTYLAWLERLALTDEETLKSHTEYSAAQILDGFRKKMPNCVGLSFSTISSIGANAAVIHYSPHPDTASQMCKDLYLVDSGGHYLYGTTDVTRTIHLGEPTPEQKDCWTRVLKGHLCLAAAKFPVDTRGPQLDVLARHFLWNAGLNYAHGTGHGVGYFLNVHEGPQTISTGIQRGMETALVPGMLVSNEPGFYAEGKFGVRIENVIYVDKVHEDLHALQDGPYLQFKQLTLVPYQKKMVDLNLITAEEIKMINEYHALTWSAVSEELKKPSNPLPFREETLQWLRDATTPLDTLRV